MAKRALGPWHGKSWDIALRELNTAARTGKGFAEKSAALGINTTREKIREINKLPK